MGRLDRLPGIDDANTTRRNAVVGGMYALAGCVAIGTLTGDGSDDDEDGSENGEQEVEEQEPDSEEDRVVSPDEIDDVGDELSQKIAAGFNHPESGASGIMEVEFGESFTDIKYMLSEEAITPNKADLRGIRTAYYVLKEMYQDGSVNIDRTRTEGYVPAEDAEQVAVSRIAIDKDTAEELDWDSIDPLGFDSRADYYWFNDSAFD